MPTLFNIKPYVEFLERGDTIITANARQCAKMRAAYSYYRHKNASVGASPNLYSLNAWMDLQWQQLQSASNANNQFLVLNAIQRQRVWRKIIAKNMDVVPLLPVEQLAPFADSAYKTIELWQVPIGNLEWDNAHYEMFAGWYKAFETTLTQNHWITSEHTQTLLLNAFRTKQMCPTEFIHLVGFDDIPPLTAELLSAAACQCTKHQVNPVSNQLYRRQLPSRREEIIAAANWAKQILLEHPEAVIGIIAPNLGQIRDQIEQIFIETFEPQYLDNNTQHYTLPFNFSAGTPLGAAPVIHEAFLLLRVLANEISFDQTIALLNSPYWKVAKHTSLTFRAILQLSNQPKENIRRGDLKRLFDTPEPNGVVKCLIDVDHQYRRLSKQLTPGEWMNVVLDLLQQLGWPGDRKLNSIEFQQVSQFQSLLERFISVGQVDSTLLFSEALSELQQQCLTTPFQPQTPDSPIQILGALEGAALHFDYCWMLNLDDQTWPPQPSPNPLLPIPLQCQLDMPNASASKQLRYAQSITERIKASANRVVFSSAATEGDSELTPSGLISGIALSTGDELFSQSTSSQFTSQSQLTSNNLQITHYQQLANWIFDNRHYCWIDCEQAKPLESDTKQAGGISVLQWQAALPINAFCRFRLGIKPLPAIEYHLSPAIKGQISHFALAKIWQTLIDQKTLLSYGDDKLLVLINASVDQALQEYSPAFTDFPDTLKKLEAERQANIIRQWLEVEKTRSDFTVEATEQSVEVSLSGLTFKLQLDRLDCQDQQRLIIDYKASSQQSISQWLPERIAAPQLPLYALHFSETINAITYAIVNGAKQQFVGMGELSTPVTGIKHREKVTDLTWPELIQAWQVDLTSLAEEFKHGVTWAHDYHPIVSRYQADYLSINRLPEKSLNYALWIKDGGNAE